MTILVTGASGFVGRTIVVALRRAGYAVRTAGHSSPNVDYRIPLGPGADWSAAVAGCGTVVHAGALAHVLNRKAAQAVASFDEINTHGTLVLAEAAAKAGVTSFIFISSIAAMGDPGEQPARETDLANPTTPYGRSKRAAEIGLEEIADRTGLTVTCLRPPLVYGPDAGGRFAQMLAWCDRHLPLPFGGIDNQRSYLGVDNLADAVCTAVAQLYPGIYHVADRGSLSTPQLLELVGRGLGKPARILTIPNWGMGALRRSGLAQPIDKLTQTLLLDGSKFERTFNWSPPTDLKDGILDAARRYRSSGR